MVRSSQDSSSTHVSRYDRIIRRGHNSENRRTPHGTEYLHSHVERRNHQRGYPSCISVQFTGTTHIHVQTPVAGYHQRTQNAGHTIGHAPFPHTDVAEPEYLRNWCNPQPSGGLYHGGFTSGAQMDAVRPGSVTGGYNPGGPRASLTPGVQTPAVGLGLNNGGFPSGAQMDAVWPGAVTGGYNPGEPGAILTAGVQTPAVGLGLNNGGFTRGAQMNAVWPGAVTGEYNPMQPGASLTPGVQTPAVGLGPARSSGVGYNQPTPNATLGFAGQTSQAPLFPEYDTQAANNDFDEGFLLPAVSDNFMHMLDQIF